MMERGEVATKMVTRRHQKALTDVILENLLAGSTIATDEFGGYARIDKSGIRHVTVHHRSGQYTDPQTGGGVNGIEGFWAMLKRGITARIFMSAPVTFRSIWGSSSIAGACWRCLT